MIAVFLRPPKRTESGEDFLLDEPDVVEWWDREKLPGNAALFDVERLRSLVRSGKLRAALGPMEGFTMVMVIRRA
jgi:hypothetical protein